MATAVAHPNIALIKYWGKAAGAGRSDTSSSENIPATPSLSITLSTLRTTTSVESADEDVVWLNAQRIEDAKIAAFLAMLRSRYDNINTGLSIQTNNNFPTSAGLASSASGFAALTAAINAHCGLGLSLEEQSALARHGSASAARSMLGGFVALAPPHWHAVLLAPESHWDLRVVVAITSSHAKAIGSSAGMALSRATSPYFSTWVDSAAADYAAATSAIEHRDFGKLADVAELNCLKMHGVMLTTQPALAYWNPASVACMEAIRSLRQAGCAVFFTNDAGPQIKAVCLPEDAERVESTLRSIHGVEQTIRCRLGSGVRLVAST